MLAFVLCLVLLANTALGSSAGPTGYRFLDGFSHTTIHFDQYKDLIIIPAQLNDTLKVNLILDTGTRSLLLYGKKFKRLQNMITNKIVRVTGWGSPSGVEAGLSFPNSIAIGEIRGSSLGIAVVNNRKLFDDRPSIDGIIGYELFVRFAVEINYKTRTIHLYDRLPEGHTAGFSVLPLEINKARPQVVSSITMSNNKTVALKLLIDTGSSLGLTVFSKTRDAFYSSEVRQQIGLGLTGIVHGFELYVKHFFLGDMRIERTPSHLVEILEHPDEDFTFSGSLGAAFLKEHIVIFDYPGSKFFISRYRNG